MTRRLEVARLRRALQLQVDRTADGYRVTGGRAPHAVTLRAGQLCCDCGDAANRPGLVCKHTLAAVIRERLGPTLFAAVRDAIGEVVNG